MKLSEKDKANLIDALKEWKECVGPKEMDEQDAGLDDDRYIDMMDRLEGTGESTIKTLFKGEFVLVDLVDETIELTVEDNVYSRSESLELLEELKMACAASRTAKSMVVMREVEGETYSKKMQDKLEPIDDDSPLSKIRGM